MAAVLFVTSTRRAGFAPAVGCAGACEEFHKQPKFISFKDNSPQANSRQHHGYGCRGRQPRQRRSGPPSPPARSAGLPTAVRGASRWPQSADRQRFAGRSRMRARSASTPAGSTRRPLRNAPGSTPGRRTGCGRRSPGRRRNTGTAPASIVTRHPARLRHLGGVPDAGRSR